ncbi:MAG: CAP domain-containing protein [Candidatus Dormibacteraceae bacterium]
MINADRSSAGLPRLNWSSCLAGVAAQSARRMANQGFISHAGAVYQDLNCGLGSRQTGENVGYWSRGVNDSQLNSMFMNSPEHRANIMGPYRWVGTAWVTAANGYGYIAVEFG